MEKDDRDIIDAIIMLLSEKDANKRINNSIEFREIIQNKTTKSKVLKETDYYLQVCNSHDKYFRCKICDSRYSYIRVMYKHLRKDHNIFTP